MKHATTLYQVIALYSEDIGNATDPLEDIEGAADWLAENMDERPTRVLRMDFNPDDMLPERIEDVTAECLAIINARLAIPMSQRIAAE